MFSNLVRLEQVLADLLDRVDAMAYFPIDGSVDTLASLVRARMVLVVHWSRLLDDFLLCASHDKSVLVFSMCASLDKIIASYQANIPKCGFRLLEPVRFILRDNPQTGDNQVCQALVELYKKKPVPNWLKDRYD
ncbi:hypothetical protein KL938_003255 [Ogataea parapolymorpha]|nr:hypothetical protein KL938_003255 [Ogataea parapolymorpha]